MDLKCVHCGKEAKYMFEGTSLCKDHLPKELKTKQPSGNPVIVGSLLPE